MKERKNRYLNKKGLNNKTIIFIVLSFLLISILAVALSGQIIIDGDTAYNSTNSWAHQEAGFVHSVLTDYDIVLYMPFDVNKSVTVYDYTQKANDGAITGATFTSSGYIGGAYEFDGVGDYILLSNEANFDFNRSDEMSVSLWLRLPTTAQASIISKFDLSYNGWELLSMGGGTDVRWQWLSGGGTKGWYIDSTNAVDDGAWHHLVGVKKSGISANSLEIYIDGSLETPSASVNVTPYGAILNDFGVYIATRSDGSVQLNGAVDEVMIYNRSLSAAEITAIYNNQSNRYHSYGNISFKTLFDFDGNNSVSVSIHDCKESANSSLRVRANGGTTFPFNSNCQANVTSIVDTANVNISIVLLTDVYNHTSPLPIGNITLDPYEVSADETQARTRIETAINNTLTGYTIYTDKQVYLRLPNGTQQLGRFDKIAAAGNQRWAINYIAGSDTYTNMNNLTPVFYVYEIANKVPSQLQTDVEAFITNTKS